MNRNRFAGMSIALMLTAICSLALAGIEGSKHDFSHRDWGEGDACGACHSPHRTNPPAAAPLWNPDADLTRTFGTAVEKEAILGNGTQMCLRCHDGTLARDTISGVTEQRFANKQNPGLFTTGHGRTDHPVGVKFPQFDKGYRPMTTILSKGYVSLPEGRVECTSCHDPHNQAGHDYMLVMSNARSALCLTCHKK